MPFITPDNVPESTTCRALLIPSSSDWLAIFSGALTELTKAYNWEQVDGMTVDDAIAAATVVINAYYDGCVAEGCQQPGGYGVFRINADGHIEQLVNGEWVEPQTPYEIPPVPPREEATPEERQCLAAANAANVLEQGYEILADAFAEGLTSSQAVVRLIEGLAIIWFWIAPILNGLVILLAGFLELVYQAFYYVTADVWDADFTDILRCWLFECSTDTGDVVTFDYDCLMSKMLSEVISPPFSEPMARLAVQLSYLIPLCGGVDFLNQAGATTEIESADCDDCLDPCRQWLGTFGLQDMLPVESSTYDAVNDWIESAVFGSVSYASAVVPVVPGTPYNFNFGATWHDMASNGDCSLYWSEDEFLTGLVHEWTFTGFGDGASGGTLNTSACPTGKFWLYITVGAPGVGATCELTGVSMCPNA